MLHKGLFSYGARAEIFTFNEVMCAGALPDDFRVRMEPLLALLVLKPDGGKMLTLEGGAEERCRDLGTCGGHVRQICWWVRPILCMKCSSSRGCTSVRRRCEP